MYLFIYCALVFTRALKHCNFYYGIMALLSLILPQCLKSWPLTVDDLGSPLHALLNHCPLVVSGYFLNMKFLFAPFPCLELSQIIGVLVLDTSSLWQWYWSLIVQGIGIDHHQWALTQLGYSLVSAKIPHAWKVLKEMNRILKQWNQPNIQFC